MESKASVEEHGMVILSDGVNTIVYVNGEKIKGLKSVVFEHKNNEEIAVLKTVQYIVGE